MHYHAKAALFVCSLATLLLSASALPVLSPHSLSKTYHPSKQYTISLSGSDQPTHVEIDVDPALLKSNSKLSIVLVASIRHTSSWKVGSVPVTTILFGISVVATLAALALSITLAFFPKEAAASDSANDSDSDSDDECEWMLGESDSEDENEVQAVVVDEKKQGSTDTKKKEAEMNAPAYHDHEVLPAYPASPLATTPSS